MAAAAVAHPVPQAVGPSAGEPEQVEVQAEASSPSAGPPAVAVVDLDRLPAGSPFPFLYQAVMRAPKADHGQVEARGQWYKTMRYEVLETGGFLRLCTVRGRLYWQAQNATGHETPDWKLHFSVCAEDLPPAWDLLAQHFVDSKCEVGMKVTTSPSTFCTGPQRGRELTVYVFVYDPVYRSGPAYVEARQGGEEFAIPERALEPERLHECDFFLGQEFAAPYTAGFWAGFITKAERLLAAAGVRPNGGTADGDLPLPHCRYASLRNEAYVEEAPGRGKQYPSNTAGWNARRHPNPLEETLYLLLLQGPIH